jgi:hypothetical protein
LISGSSATTLILAIFGLEHGEYLNVQVLLLPISLFRKQYTLLSKSEISGLSLFISKTIFDDYRPVESESTF